MTNPNNIVRVRARNGGRASVYEANGWAQAYTTGLLEGNGVIQNTSADMNVLVGGSATKPDVVLAENAAGYRIALDLVGQQAIAITNPASNSRISAIVAYTDDLSLSTTQDNVTGSPSSCGLIVVNGTAASTPSAPTDTQIRNAITADGATGSQAVYCVIATILVASNTTAITNTLITTNVARIGADNIDFTTFKPRWKTVASSTSSSVVLPAGYRKYRLSLSYNRTAVSFGCLFCNKKTGSSFIYVQGMSDGNWIHTERTVSSGDLAIIDLARTNISAGFSVYSVELSRETVNATNFQSIYQATSSGTLTYVSGKSGFTVSSNDDLIISAESGSNYSWIVEAYDE